MGTGDRKDVNDARRRKGIDDIFLNAVIATEKHGKDRGCLIFWHNFLHMFPIALPNGCRKAEKAVPLCLLVFQRAFLNRTRCRNTTASQKHRRINLPGITIGMRRANLYRARKLIADLRLSCNFFCRLATCIKIDTTCGFFLFPCCFDRLSRKRETQSSVIRGSSVRCPAT